MILAVFDTNQGHSVHLGDIGLRRLDDDRSVQWKREVWTLN